MQTPNPAEDHVPRAIISLDRGELAQLKDVAACSRPYAERLSTGFVIRMLTTARQDAEFVLDAIDGLEGLRSARSIKQAEQFRHPPLHPLWHQHFSAPRHMLRNLGERWGIARGTGNRDLDRLIDRVAHEHGDVADRWPGILSHWFAHGYVERAQQGRLTGDWIVFAQHEGANYYLDLATHEEGQPENAARLLAKLRNAANAEFPFAFEPC